jgi:hypothetical protein
LPVFPDLMFPVPGQVTWAGRYNLASFLAGLELLLSLFSPSLSWQVDFLFAQALNCTFMGRESGRSPVGSRLSHRKDEHRMGGRALTPMSHSGGGVPLPGARRALNGPSSWEWGRLLTSFGAHGMNRRRTQTTPTGPLSTEHREWSAYEDSWQAVPT